jgi:hypothetical protein
VCGRPRVMNGQLPPTTGATLANSEGLAHRSTTRINSRRRRTAAPKTPLLDDARRKHMAHNFPLGIFLKGPMTRSSRRRNVKQLKKIHPYFLQYCISLYLCTNFTMAKCHLLSVRSLSYPDLGRTRASRCWISTTDIKASGGDSTYCLTR